MYRGRCQLCSKDREQQTHQTGRLTPTSGRIYKRSKWARTREAVFAQKGRLCLTCLANGRNEIATQVDHIVPIEEGGEPWAIANLQPICLTCHSRKTRSEQLTAPAF